MQELVSSVVFVVVTANGAQPTELFKVNAGVNGDSIQMVLVTGGEKPQYP